METLRLKAPAKVNFRLDVLGKRADGYHEVRMVMRRIDLCDDIVISLSERPGIRVACGSAGVPDGPGNIAWRAAEALAALSGTRPGIDIAISKNIPVAAGLGGGSSDAASVLMGVNELLRLGLSDERLMEVGVKLGADVPFFIFKHPALAEGIGERLTAISGMPEVWLAIVNPRIPVSTAWAYQNLQLTKKEVDYNITRFYGTVPDLCAQLANDLETVTISRFPVIREIKERLIGCGAGGALMSGSGPTVFGVFTDEETARRCIAELAGEKKWFSAVVKTL